MYVHRITNKINGKNYIGITNNPHKRWSNERSYPTNPEKKRQVIQEAIHRYGKENFSFEILYSNLTVEEACELEAEMAIKYNSYAPHGYNIAKCGVRYTSASHDIFGENNPNAKITIEEAQYILDNRNKPMYALYKEKFEDKICYSYFKDIYNHNKYTYLQTTTEMYPSNLEYSLQFSSGNLDYEDVILLREKYSKGIYWEEVYQEYKDIYPNKWDFWNIYYGNRYHLVMPEVFSKENKKYHSSIGKQGEKNSRAKLNNEDAKEIRRLWASGVSREELYKLYSQVTPTSVRNVINNKTFKNVL